MTLLATANLDPTQRASVVRLLNKKVQCITSDCGGGKTVIGLTVHAVMQERDPESKMLVTCTPAGVSKVWNKEHLKWKHLKHLRVCVLNGTIPQRKKLLEQDWDVYVLSYGTLRWLREYTKAKSRRINFKFTYADEGECLKGPSSKYRAHLIILSKKTTHRIVATATPKTRDEDDYWGICKFLDDGKCLKSRTLEIFRAKFCKRFTLPSTGATLFPINRKKVEKLERMIAPLFFRYELPDEAKIPIKTITVNASLSKKSQKKYDKLSKTQLLNSIIFKKVIIEGVEHEVKDHDESLGSAQLSAKLNQLSSGFVYMDQHTRISPKMLAKATTQKDIRALMKEAKKRISIDIFDDRIKKFGKLLNHIDKVHNCPSIAIVYYFKHELEQLKRLLPDATCDTDKDYQDDWDAGNIKNLLLQYNRSSKALNLQKGGFIMAMYSPTFFWQHDYQIVRRLARQGQPEPCVYVYRLYMRGTVDDEKVKRLGQRSVTHSRFQNRILQKLRSPQP